MITPSQDKELNKDLNMIIDNLMEIFHISDNDRGSLKNHLIKEIIFFVEASGYHKDCKIS